MRLLRGSIALRAPISVNWERISYMRTTYVKICGHVEARSFELLDLEDLRRLSRVALSDLNDFFARCPKTGALYGNRLLLLCLCQGAAEHFVRPGRGVKDLDVWAFYDVHPTKKHFPWHRRGTADFGCSRLGRHPDDHGFVGRRVDVFGRSIAHCDDQTPAMAIQTWLQSRRTSARYISQRPVVAIFPDDHCGEVIWNPFAQASN